MDYSNAMKYILLARSLVVSLQESAVIARELVDGEDSFRQTLACANAEEGFRDFTHSELLNDESFLCDTSAILKRAAEICAGICAGGEQA